MASFAFGKWLATPSAGEEVVISGVSGKFPESENIYEFKENLFNKRDMVTDDNRRWDLDHPEIPRRTAKIYNIDKFDAGFFGVHHRQANIMDPIIRKVLETTIEAIVDAGINPSELKGTRTGVFIGASTSEAETNTLCQVTEPQKFAVTGFLRCFIPNRISYYLKLKGPSTVVDTACSSSLNALEIGFKAIRCGQCDNAIIGGVNLLLHPGATLQFARLGVLSIDGVCKVFDQEANGYVRSETIAIVFLQKAKTAKRIYSQIVYAKVNCDGFKPQGITFPSTQMQQELMNDVLKDSGTAASDLSFLEAHGTGTEVGDPQEVEAIDYAIAKKRNKPLWIGSVKCNIGHSETGSGLGSLIKVIIAMETGLISPNINIKNIRKELKGFEEGRLKLVTELTELEGDDALVGINNFGFGGNNCHMIARRFKKKKIDWSKPQDSIPRLVCVSGRTKESVLELINDIHQRPLDREYVALFHQVFKKDIPSHLYRGYTVVSNKGVLNSSVKFLGSETPVYVFFGSLLNNFKILGQNLMNFPIFKASMLRINDIFNNEDINIIDIIQGKIEQKNNLLPAAAVQIGFVDVLKHLEIKPSSVFGESIGKLIAGYYYKIITLQETVLTIKKMENSEASLRKIDFETNFANLVSPKNINSFRSIFYNKHICSEENKSEEFLSYKNLINSKALVLNLSDEFMSKNDLFSAEETYVKFLESLGRLYLEGHNPQIHKLYPSVQFPVSRNTPMISPLIKWNHKRSWYTYKFKSFGEADKQQSEYNLNYIDEDCRYIMGHVIDGRNFVPATEYLSLVWQSFAQSTRLLITDAPVVFENCKFNRATTITKGGLVKLLVSIQKGTGQFEILEKNSVVVSGRIYCPTDVSVHKTNLPYTPFNETNRSMYLEQDEIYRELYLRGYNYSGLFKGIVKCNVDATSGLIKWEDNWTTFMDKMLQMKILSFDTRSLYVPVGIKKITIDPLKHLALIDKIENLVSVNVFPESNIIKSGEIEIVGLQAKAIAKRKPTLEPVLEKHVFTSNRGPCSLTEALRIDTQIILEHSTDNNFKAVELFDEFTKTNTKFLLPIVNLVLDNVPLVNPDLTISTKSALEDIPNIKINNFVLTPSSNLVLVIGTELLQSTKLNTILSALSCNGFVITREETNATTVNVDNVEVVTEYVTENEKLILLRKSELIENLKCIEITTDTFLWLPQLQNALKCETNIIVYSQNQKLSGILGLVNCIRREPGGNRVKCFFMIDDAPKFDPSLAFYQTQIKKNLAMNVYKNGEWGTYRHLLLEKTPEVRSEHIYVNNLIKGDLSSLKWIQGPLSTQTPLEGNNILIYNYYSAINFKDIMLASGRISADSITRDRIEQECLLGFEFAGRDANGQRVNGLGKSGALSTYSVANPAFIWRVSEDWSMEQAASIPAVYSTVIYSLFKVISLKPGMSLLIHSATGGVGIATINICLYFGYKIFATVGTSEKKKYLREQFPQIPESHIGNSHDTSFEEMIKIQTKGRGVDVVLNSLAEEKLIASVRCLARGGHLLEIGKFDLENDNSLSMFLLEKQISYHGIMMERIFAQSFEVKKWLVDQIYEGTRLGYIKPLPVTVFQPNEIETAFRHMTTGKHMGKILIKIRDEEEEKIVKPSKTHLTGVPRFNCDVEKCYIIIGGLGGVGMELADWLVVRGARNLVLVSTSGIKSGYQVQRINIWKSYGANIYISTSDVTTKEGCIQLVKQSKLYGPIDGIFNLAVVLKDALFEDQTEEMFQISLSPKAQATKYIDEVTRTLCPKLKYFVVFSSVSCGRGNVGQTNYGMANSVMERICEKRKQDGFPALAIQWGAIGEVGLVAKMQKENKELVIGGTLQQKVYSCLEALDKFLNQEHPIVASMIVAEKRNKKGGTNAVGAIAYILGIKDLNKVDKNATFAELGMDSIVGTEVIQLLENDYEIYISSKEIRSLTFARILELETEKNKINKVKNEDNNNKGANMLLQRIPKSPAAKLPVIKLPTNITDKENIPTAFMLCGLEGIFEPLECVCRQLNANVFGLQYSYDNPQDTIKDTAELMLPHVKEHINDDNNCFVIGYSYGTSVALELAALLESKGYKCTLMLVDGSPSYLYKGAIDYLPHDTEAEFETMLLCKLLAMVLPADLVMQKKNDLLKFSTFEERTNLALSMLPKHLTDINLEKQGAIVVYKRFKSVINYKFVHNKIKSSVYLFKAKYPMISNVDNDYNLSEYCEQPIQVKEVDGDHVTILNQSSLADDINKILQLKAC